MMRKSLNESVLINLLTELNMAKAKQSVLREKGMDTDKIDARIEALETALDIHQDMMLEDK
jgi:hypothetical protein